MKPLDPYFDVLDGDAGVEPDRRMRDWLAYWTHAAITAIVWFCIGALLWVAFHPSLSLAGLSLRGTRDLTAAGGIVVLILADIPAHAVVERLRRDAR